MITWLLFMLIVLLQYFLMFFVGSHWSIDILAEAVYQVISLMIFLCLGACNARTVHQCHHEFLACVMLEVDESRNLQGSLGFWVQQLQFQSFIQLFMPQFDWKTSNLTLPQDGGLELWGMLQIPIQPWHIFATVDSWRIYFHLMNWPVLPFEHWWPTDQASKSGWLHSRVFLVSISIWVTLLEDRVFLYTYKCSQMKCACHFYYHFLPVFLPQETRWLPKGWIDWSPLSPPTSPETLVLVGWILGFL